MLPPHVVYLVAKKYSSWRGVRLILFHGPNLSYDNGQPTTRWLTNVYEWNRLDLQNTSRCFVLARAAVFAGGVVGAFNRQNLRIDNCVNTGASLTKSFGVVASYLGCAFEQKLDCQRAHFPKMFSCVVGDCSFHWMKKRGQIGPHLHPVI